jgi:hypothetical protein
MNRLLAAAACVMTLAAVPAYGASFATFTQVGGDDTISFTNNGDGTGTLTSIGDGVFDFTYLSPFLSGLPSDLVGDQEASFSLTADATSPAGMSGPVVEQGISSGTISFTRTTPIDGHSNLLTIVFTNGFLWGPQDASGLNLIASSATGGVTFTSDFIDFTGSTQRDFNFSLQGMSTPVAIGDGGLLESFTADTSGLASVQTQGGIPEPATWALMVIGFGGAGAVMRARQRLQAA